MQAMSRAGRVLACCEQLSVFVQHRLVQYRLTRITRAFMGLELLCVPCKLAKGQPHSALNPAASCGACLPLRLSVNWAQESALVMMVRCLITPYVLGKAAVPGTSIGRMLSQMH